MIFFFFGASLPDGLREVWAFIMRRDQVSLVCRCKRSADGPRGADLWIRWLTDRFPIHPLPSPISEDFPGVQSSVIKISDSHYWNSRILFLSWKKGFFFYSQPTFGSARRSNLSGGGGIRICIYLFFSGPELSSAPAASKMKSVAVWMCIHTFLLLIGEMWIIEIWCICGEIGLWKWSF